MGCGVKNTCGFKLFAFLAFLVLTVKLQVLLTTTMEKRAFSLVVVKEEVLSPLRFQIPVNLILDTQLSVELLFLSQILVNQLLSTQLLVVGCYFGFNY
jgi:hypothetical protein